MPGPSGRGPPRGARRSIPAQNALSPVPVRTTARTASSVSAAANALPMPTMVSASRALRRSGRSMVTTSVVPWSSAVTGTAPDATDGGRRRSGSDLVLEGGDDGGGFAPADDPVLGQSGGARVVGDLGPVGAGGLGGG